MEQMSNYLVRCAEAWQRVIDGFPKCTPDELNDLADRAEALPEGTIPHLIMVTDEENEGGTTTRTNGLLTKWVDWFQSEATTTAVALVA